MTKSQVLSALAVAVIAVVTLTIAVNPRGIFPSDIVIAATGLVTTAIAACGRALLSRNSGNVGGIPTGDDTKAVSAVPVGIEHAGGEEVAQP